MRIKSLIAASLFLAFSSVFAQSKADVTQMLENMAASGHLSEAQIKQAREELGRMSEKDFKNLVEAGKAMRNDPRIKQEIKEMKLGQ